MTKLIIDIELRETFHSHIMPNNSKIKDTKPKKTNNETLRLTKNGAVTKRITNDAMVRLRIVSDAMTAYCSRKVKDGEAR